MAPRRFLVPSVLLAVCALVLGAGVVAAVRAGAATPSTLTVGQRLPSGAVLQSTGGRYRLVMQTDGNLVARRVAGNVAVWSTRTPGHPGAGLVLQADGNLVLHPRLGAAIWKTDTGVTRGNAFNTLRVQDDGNLVLRAESGRVLWSSGADRAAPPLETGDVLRAGGSWRFPEVHRSGTREFVLDVYSGMMTLDQHIERPGVSSYGTAVWSAGQDLFDVSAPTVLTLQADGNLVLTGRGRVQWASGTRGTGAANTFSVQNDGNLVLRNAAGRAVWSAGSAPAFLPSGRTLPPGGHLRNTMRVDRPTDDLTMQPDGNLVLRYGGAVAWSSASRVPGSRLVMQPDGNAVVVAPSGAAVWSTGTAGHRGARLLVGPVRNVQVTGDSMFWSAP